MKFVKDLLMFHLQTTGQNPDKDNILQVSGIILDKDNLLEKNFFSSYIKVSFLDSTLKQHSEILGIDPGVLQKSPKQYEALKEFTRQLGTDATLATFGPSNNLFLRAAFKKSLISYPYSNHVLDLWSLAYIYTMHYGINKIPTLDTLASHFRLQKKSMNNAIDRARLSAEVLRHIVR